MSEPTTWYIIKAASGVCQITSKAQASDKATQDRWGPYKTREEAIAKRVGLIRAGKCQPI